MPNEMTSIWTKLNNRLINCPSPLNGPVLIVSRSLAQCCIEIDDAPFFSSPQ